MTPNHLYKIKRTLLELNRSPSGIKASVLAGIAQELGRAASMSVLKDVAVWEAYLQGDDEYQ